MERRQRLLRLFRSWSSPPDDVRQRRPTDILLLLAASLVLIGLGVYFHGTTTAPTPPDADPGSIVKLADWFADFGYALVLGWAVILVLLPIFSRGRRRLLLDYVLGAALALLVGVLVSHPADGGWTETLKQVLTATPAPVDVVGPIAIATAIIVIASPHVTRPLRWTGRVVVLLGAVSAVVLDLTETIGGLAAIASGIAAAAVVHLLLGTPSGHSTAEQVADGLDDIGLEVDSIALSERQEVGSSRFDAVGQDQQRLHVTVYGRDAWDDQFLGSLYTSLNRRGEQLDLFGGRKQRVEHEALVTVLAQRGGIPVLPVVAVGESDDGDAIIVVAAAAKRLDEVEQVDDDHLAQCWSALEKLHALGIAHRDVSRQSLVLRDDGTVAFTAFDQARLGADDIAMMIDRVRLLVGTAIAVGSERAVAAAGAALGTEGMAQLLPYLQSAVLDRAQRKGIEGEEWDLASLRADAVAFAGVEPPELYRVQRVTWKRALGTIAIGILAYLIITKLAGVDWSSIAADLEGADKKWLLLALLMSPFVQSALAFSTLGATMARLRYIPVLMLQYAIQFIALTLPATAARLALEVRFFQKFGLPPAGAVSTGMIDSFFGFLVQCALLAVILLSGLPGLTTPIRGSSSGSSSSSTTSSGPSAIVILLVVLIVGGLLALIFVPKFRARIKGIVPRIKEQISESRENAKTAMRVLRHPVKLVTMLLGNFVAQVIQAAILGVCLYAFGDTAHLSQLILINTGVSLFSGLMPVPGGMGVAEAGYTAGLQAIGVDSSVAISTAIAMRMVTFYLPPIWGAGAMGWLRRRDYV
ncbi:MAG: lysylphosphatidylglycerol synthase transmembrane domain-containing protein [Candidatus Nanopelagicales bacterium]